ncbi:MAG: hypothetical protein FD169_1461 [Bacillota bacterium]|nr:MAG: hypothetical protein FD169_1461 [Bacillota bacterium]
MHQFAEFEMYLRFDPGQRGLAQELRPGTLAIAADRLLQASRITIATGFFVPAAGAVETDGPPGAAFLARALERLGKQVTILCPQAALQAMLVCKEHLQASFTVFPLTPGTIVSQGILDEVPCDVFVGLEYPGQGADGTCRNMRGRDISEFVPILDGVLNAAKIRGLHTIAVGDGGNELGCGSAGFRVAYTPEGTCIASVSDADTIICAGISNWGAYAVIAALSVLENAELLPTAEEEYELLLKLCSVGVVDGCTHNCVPTVDGMTTDVCIGFLRELNALTEQFLEQRKAAATSA